MMIFTQKKLLFLGFKNLRLWLSFLFENQNL